MVQDNSLDAVPPFMEDPVAIACAAVVMALLLCLAIALFVRHRYNSTPALSSKSIKAVPLDQIPSRCYCCQNPGYKRPRKPLPKLALYIPEVTDKYVFKMWEAPEVSQTCAAPNVDDLL